MRADFHLFCFVFGLHGERISGKFPEAFEGEMKILHPSQNLEFPSTDIKQEASNR